MKYGLRTEPWIPVIHLDGTTAELGMRDLLREAHTLREIRDPLPTAEFGLNRLMVALVLDIFFDEPGIEAETPALSALLSKGHFDADRVDAYFEKYADRFNLFHSEQPWLQTKDTPGGLKPLANLLPPQPSGTGTIHFHHSKEDEFGVSPAAAARLLATIAPFMTAGGAGLAPSVNGAPPWYVLIRGTNLFETLCRNLATRSFTPQATGKEPVAWRSVRPVGGAGRSTGASYAQSLTWRPRRILLVPDERGGRCALTGEESPVLVRQMRFAPGDSCDFQWRDPNAAYTLRADEKDPAKAATIRRPRENRELWRDIGPLALLTEGDKGSDDNKIRFARPRILDQLKDLPLPAAGKHAPLELAVYGMRTDMKMKIFEWQHGILSPPRPLVVGSYFHADAQEAMNRADGVASLIGRVLKKAYPRDGKGNDKAQLRRITYAQRAFWGAVHGPYNDFLQTLSRLAEAATIAGSDPEARLKEKESARETWAEAVKSAARQVTEEALEGMGSDADALRRQTLALSALHSGLRFSFETPDQKTTRLAAITAKKKAAEAAGKASEKAARSKGTKS